MNANTCIFLRNLGALFNVWSRYACFLVLLLHFTFFCKQVWLSLISPGSTVLWQLFLSTPSIPPQPRFYWQHELQCLVYKNLLTFRLSLAAPVTGLFKGCSKKLLDALTNSQICKAIQPLSEFNSPAVNNRGKLLGLIHPWIYLQPPPQHLNLLSVESSGKEGQHFPFIWTQRS